MCTLLINLSVQAGKESTNHTGSFFLKLQWKTITTHTASMENMTQPVSFVGAVDSVGECLQGHTWVVRGASDTWVSRTCGCVRVLKWKWQMWSCLKPQKTQASHVPPSFFFSCVLNLCFRYTSRMILGYTGFNTHRWAEHRKGSEKLKCTVWNLSM